jgi:hypothetical protein
LPALSYRDSLDVGKAEMTMRGSDQGNGSLFSYVDLGSGFGPIIRCGYPRDRQPIATSAIRRL